VIGFLLNGDIFNDLPSRTLNSVFKVTTFFEVEYFKNLSYRQSYYSTMIGNHTSHMEWYHVW